MWKLLSPKYSQTSVVEHNSFWKAVRKPIFSKTESLEIIKKRFYTPKEYSETSVLEGLGVGTIRFSNKLWGRLICVKEKPRFQCTHGVEKSHWRPLLGDFLSDKRLVTFFFWRPSCLRGHLRQLIVAEGQCSGPCNSVCRFHVMRAPLTLTLYRAWTWWSPKKRSSCFFRTESASTQTVKASFQHRMYIQRSVALWCRLIFPSICSRTEILFENQIVFISKFLFENRIVRTPKRSKTEVWLYNFLAREIWIFLSCFSWRGANAFEARLGIFLKCPKNVVFRFYSKRREVLDGRGFLLIKELLSSLFFP